MKENNWETYHLKELDRNGFVAAVYNRYGKKLYSYAMHSWKLGEDAAWDLVYKTVYKVADTYASYAFASEQKFASFVFKIFINYLRNYYRDHKEEKAFEFSAIAEMDVSNRENETESPPGAKMLALNEVLEQMEDWERMLLLMRSEGRAYAEIATYIDKPEEQLKVYYQRLKEKLSKRLHERMQLNGRAK